MKQPNHLSKKELRMLVNSKITAAISEIAGTGKIPANVETAIKKASKLISAKFRKSLNAASKSTAVAEPVQVVVVKKEISGNKTRRKTANKSSKSSGAAKKIAGRTTTTDRTPVKKVKVARRAVRKGVDPSKNSTAATAGTLPQTDNN
jgi:hypothetical protein